MKNHIFQILAVLCFNVMLSYSQSFQFKGNNLYGLEYFKPDSTKTAVKIFFYDLDSDGDQDAITVGVDDVDYSGDISFNKITYFITMQENIGNKWNPSFAPRKSFVDDFPFPNGYFFPAIGDLNHDNKVDMFVTAGTDEILNIIPLYYERKSLTGPNQYNIIPASTLDLNPFIAGSFFMPELVDMDMDGDLDILLSGFLPEIDPNTPIEQQPVFMYAKNIGTTSQPSFVGWYQNPYGLTSSADQNQLATVGDVDNDNDVDVLSLTTMDTFKLFKLYKNNPQPNGKPSFQPAFPSPFGLPKVGQSEQMFPPTLVDIDGDGDLDLFMVQQLLSSGNGIGYYENVVCSTTLDNTVAQTQTSLTANASNVSYQWFNCNTNLDISGATSQTFTPSVSGVYGVRVSDANGCKNTSTCYSFIITNTEDIEFASKIVLFPNPTSDQVTIQNNTGKQLKKVSFINSEGKVVQTINNVHGQIESVSGFAVGNYIVEIISGDVKVYKKLVVVEK